MVTRNDSQQSFQNLMNDCSPLMDIFVIIEILTRDKQKGPNGANFAYPLHQEVIKVSEIEIRGRGSSHEKDFTTRLT